jgi:hypothetical protein
MWAEHRTNSADGSLVFEILKLRDDKFFGDAKLTSDF